MFYLSQRPIAINLAIMALVWLIVSFCYYLINFLTNTFDQVYLTAISSGVSELAGAITGGTLFAKLGLKASLSISFGFALTGSSLLLLYGLEHEDSWLFPVLILLAKYGITSAFTIIYVSHNKVFPVLFAATAFGFCNFTSRVFTSLSPIFAQMEEPVPAIVFFILTVVGILIVWGVKQEVKKQKEPEL